MCLAYIIYSTAIDKYYVIELYMRFFGGKNSRRHNSNHKGYTGKHENQRRIETVNEELSLFQKFIENGSDGMSVMNRAGHMLFINSISAKKAWNQTRRCQ